MTWSPTHSIRKSDLQRQLARSAQVRSAVSLLSILPVMLVLGLLLPEQPNGDLAPMLVAVTFFGVPLVVSWLLTKFYCKGAVRCPHCAASLWSCGTGNFKPWRMKVRSEATQCPECQTPIR